MTWEDDTQHAAVDLTRVNRDSKIGIQTRFVLSARRDLLRSLTQGNQRMWPTNVFRSGAVLAFLVAWAICGDGVGQVRASANPAPTNPFGARYDPLTRALVLTGPQQALRSDKRDSVRVPSGSKGHRVVQAPWFNAGSTAAIASTEAAVRAAKAAGISPSVILLPIDTMPRWSWTDATTVRAINQHPNSARMKSVLGVPALWESGWSTSRVSTASAALRAEYLRELERSVEKTARGAWPGTPVVVVLAEGSSRLTASAANVLSCVGSSSIVLGNRSGNASDIVARAIESVRPVDIGVTQAVQSANSNRPGVNSGPSVAQPLNEGGTWSLKLLDGTAIIDRWKPRSARQNPADPVEPSVSVSGTVDGLRIDYTFRNDGQSARAMEPLELPPLLLGERIIIRDFRELGDGVGIDARSNGWAGIYPADLYCPALVATNEHIAIGVAIQYPMIEYKHEIRVGVAPEMAGRWRPIMAFTNAESTPYEQRLQFCGVIQPGESKAYRVNVRVASASGWPRTLEPYRDFLRSTYGEVAYTRDLRPVAGVSMAMGELQSATNPYGWVPEVGDPAIDGYLRGSRHVASHFNCADRVMVWTPTGLSANGPITYPFQFASGLRTYGALQSISPQPESGAARLRGITGADRDLGLWWGRSASVERYWNGSSSSEPINPSNREHLALAWAELDAAVEAGARTIGLDAFAHTLSPAWNLWPMLKMARMRHPQLKFVTEGRSCDVLHLIAPTWCDGYRYRPVAGRQERIPVARFEVADYLAPGHETWVGMQFDRSRNPRLWGANCSLGAQLEEIRQVAKLGYVPVSWLPVDLRQITGP